MGQVGAAGDANSRTATTPEDHQQYIAAQYTNSYLGPIIKGGEVSGNPGGLNYRYNAGAGLVPTPYGAQAVTWKGGTTADVPIAASPRWDVIYADEWGNIHVDGLSYQPPTSYVRPTGSCILDVRYIDPGDANTSYTYSVRERLYATPYGASLGYLSPVFIESYVQGQLAIQERITWCSRSFEVFTDRRLQMRMKQCIYGDHDPAAPSTDFNNFGMGSMKYWMYINDKLYRSFELGYSRVWEVKNQIVDFEVNAGKYTVRLERQKIWGIAAPIHFGSPDNVWEPGQMGIWDDGVKE